MLWNWRHIFSAIYKQNLLNFKHHFLFDVPSKISSFYHNFKDKATYFLSSFAAWETYQKLKNLNIVIPKWKSIFINFERVLRHGDC
jgi:hypothetical protein